MATTEVRFRFRATRAQVYQALLDPSALQEWKVPDGMRSEIHAFDPRVGGYYRISLTYLEPGVTGKTTERTDTYSGRFIRLVHEREVVEETEFETADPALKGKMTITMRLEEIGDKTEIIATLEGLPSGVLPESNIEGWNLSLKKLKNYLEGS